MKKLTSATAKDRLKQWLKIQDALSALKKEAEDCKGYFKGLLGHAAGELEIEKHVVSLTEKEKRAIDLPKLRKELGKGFAKFEKLTTYLEFTIKAP